MNNYRNMLSSFRSQTGGITPRPNGIQPCSLIGHPVPDGYFESFSPESNGCGRCNCVIPDVKDCPDVFGQWLGGADDNVDESTCNCNFQSAGCVMTGGLLDSTTRRPSKSKLPMMRSASGRRRASVSERESPIQYGIPVCLDPNATNTYDGPMQGVELGALLFGGKAGGSNPCTELPCYVYPDQSECDYGPKTSMRSATGGRDIDGFFGTDKGTFK